MGKIKKIIMLSHMLFCQRDYERFGIRILQENGFEVEYWELVPFLYPKVFREVKVPDPFQFPGYRKFYDFNQFKLVIANLNESCFVISFLSYEPNTYGIYKAISKKRLQYSISIMGGSFPMLFLDREKNNKMKAFVSMIYGAAKKVYWFSKAIVKGDMFNLYIFPRIHFSWLGVRPADLILACTALNLCAATCPMNKKTELLCIHNFDYDVYLDEMKKDKFVDMRLGVFLDEYMSFHPDNVYDNIDSPLKPEEYYPELCRFFDYLEVAFDVKIIIAAHPRSHYEKHPDYFGGREVIRGQTAQLVRSAGFVLAHASTSINYAVLFQKPVIFITTDKINNTILAQYMQRIANALGKDIVNISYPLKINWNKQLKIDDYKYMQYKHCFIKKKNTEELPLWQVVANRIKCY